MSKSEKVIKAALGSAVREAVKQSPVPASPFETETIVREAIAEAAPVIVHASNAEPLHKSRVVIGNVSSIMLAVAGIYTLFKTGMATAETLSVPVGIILANGFSLYGRIFATKPLGE